MKVTVICEKLSSEILALILKKDLNTRILSTKIYRFLL